MEHRALGKGLSALIPEKVDLEKKTNQQGVSFVDIDNIVENSFQPRKNYDKAKLTDLESSIKEKGILQPILVRPKGERYEVVAGERRLLAARGCSLSQVPVIIRDVSDQESLVLALIENIQREELNPIEEANAFNRLLSDFNLTHEEVAQSVGKDRSTITNTMRLLKLPMDIQQKVSSGDISMGHARALLSLEDPHRQKELVKKILAKGLSVRETENLVRLGHDAGLRKPRKKQKNVNPDLMNLEEDLQKILGTKVRIQADKKRGKIIIEYYSPDDLDRIIDVIRR